MLNYAPEKYLALIFAPQEDLEVLLDKDEALWKNALETIHAKKKKHLDEIAAFVEKQRKMLDEIIEKAQNLQQ